MQQSSKLLNYQSCFSQEFCRTPQVLVLLDLLDGLFMSGSGGSACCEGSLWFQVRIMVLTEILWSPEPQRWFWNRFQTDVSQTLCFLSVLVL